MKLFFCLILIIPTLLFGQQDNWSTVTKDKYSISHPENWEFVDGIMGMSFVILAPLDSATDQFRENVNLLEQEMMGMDLTLDSIVSMNLSMLPNFITNFELISNERIEAENSYQKLVYNGTQGILNMTVIQFFMITPSTGYFLTFTADQREFEKYAEIGEQILKTFKPN